MRIWNLAALLELQYRCMICGQKIEFPLLGRQNKKTADFTPKSAVFGPSGETRLHFLPGRKKIEVLSIGGVLTAC